MKRLIDGAALADKEQIKQALTRIDYYRNSINAIEYEWPKGYALRPLLSMLALMARIVCDVLETMANEIIKREEGVNEPDTLEEA